MNTTPLSDTQTVILAAACARDERRVFPVTARIKGGAVGNVCKSLLRRGLVEEIAATDLYTVWRHDEELGPVTLRATERAFQVLGIADGPKYDDIDPSGATVVEIAERSGWMEHSICGLMSGTFRKNLGLTISSEKDETRGRVYRIV
ncbi:DUF3489 domain-containing protein [Aquibium sp. ELW1220]|uniref:DUF3489 domain-containing protein n=1 Tax=Aquibium sp. ELW1220 TaxID=2976766 RepID=UPI0025B0BB4A|nr:DUF3489 domain-containing protein [Aquibium sp. ELW1220]MDN2578735.1 DUF3489 domain-containing protein [Aquibium sp. ELW1220]